MQEIEGVYVANVTPFRDDGTLAVDEEAYLEHVAWLAEMGVRGVVPAFALAALFALALGWMLTLAVRPRPNASRHPGVAGGVAG